MRISPEITLTTDAGGDGTAYSIYFNGMVMLITYDGWLDAGADLVVTTETTGINVLTKDNIGAAAVQWRPVATLQAAADGSDSDLEDYIHNPGERLLFTIENGGAADTGVFTVWFLGDEMATKNDQ